MKKETVFVKAVIAETPAKALGSATSSVLMARHILCLSFLSGTAMAAVLRPAKLNAFVGARSVIELFLFVSFTEAKGTYMESGEVISQWISSETTVTLLAAHSSPTF